MGSRTLEKFYQDRNAGGPGILIKGPGILENAQKQMKNDVPVGVPVGVPARRPVKALGVPVDLHTVYTPPVPNTIVIPLLMDLPRLVIDIRRASGPTGC